MKLFVLILVTFLHSLPGFSQKEFNNWGLGRAILNFNTTPPSSSYFWQVGPVRRGSAVSDSLGNLLFFAYENIIKDRILQTMPNSLGLNGGPMGVEPVYAIKKAGEDSIYYVFTVGDLDYAQYGLKYSLLDMRLRSGYGDIINGFKNLNITGGENARCSLTGTRHKNNKDVWIVTKKSTTPEYLAFLINNMGIQTPPVVSPSIVPLFGGTQDEELVISRDGTKMIFTGIHFAEFSKFNPATGQVTPLFKFFPRLGMNLSLGTDTTCNFAEFSRESNYLYITAKYTFPSSQTHFLYYQYDATLEDSAAFMQSEVLLGTDITFGCLQLAPDGQIYIARNPEDRMHIIHSPSSPGLSCQFDSAAFQLTGGSWCYQGLPQYLEKYKAYIHHSGKCQGDSINFSGDIWPPADSIRWNFGDPASGANNVSTATAPKHYYSNPGTYQIELYVRYNDNRTDTSWININVSASPDPQLGSDQSVCTGDSVTFDAGFFAGCNYLWKELPAGLVVGTGQTYTAHLTGTYAVYVSNADCMGIDTVVLISGTAPQLTNNPLSKTICSGESTNIQLYSTVLNAQFNWTATLSSGNVTGFSADSGNLINQTLINAGPGAGVVTYHIIPKLGNCIGSGVDFPVTVTPGDSVKISISESLNNICAGDSVTFTAIPAGSGTLSYQWKVNNINSGTNSSTYKYLPVNGDVVTCILTSSNSVCTSNNPATSNGITMVVKPVLTVGVSLVPPLGVICQGTQETFGTSVTNGGLAPVYQWHVNGSNVGTGQPTYSYIPTNGDLINCTVTSSEQCAFPNPVPSSQFAVSTSPMLAVDVTMNPNQNPICSGQIITFTATAINGGTNPSYQWKVNNINVGTNSNVYSFIPNNNDIVTCTLTSNVSCPIQNPVSSSQFPVSSITSPVVNFQSCFDTITTVNARPFKLKGGIPLGGIYSGPGVNSVTGMFSPSLAGIGNKTINYSYTNVGSCSDAKTKSIVILTPSAFICGNLYTDIRDNRAYKTVLIGSQCWFAEDLDYGAEINLNQHQRDNCLVEKYRNPASSIQHPASAYQWDELMQYTDIPGQQGLCPAGWHIPTETEWQTLFNYNSGNAFAAATLKFSGFSGFDAILAGASHQNSGWKYPDWATFFWTSTSYGTDKAVSHAMNLIDPSVSTYYSSKNNAFSVRCVHD